MTCLPLRCRVLREALTSDRHPRLTRCHRPQRLVNWPSYRDGGPHSLSLLAWPETSYEMSMLQATMPDRSVVESLVRDAYREIGAQVDYKREIHALLQRAIANLSTNFALRAIKEYVLPRFRGDKEGRVDVVWTDGSVPIIAFEVDARYRTKSLKKLLAVNANLRFWVYYGSEGFEPRVRELDPTGIVHIIRLPKRIPKGEPNRGFAKIRIKYPKAYERWTSEEDDLLQQQLAEGISISELSKRFQRRPGAIHSRLKKLELCRATSRQTA